LQSGQILLHKDFTVYFKTELLKNCINLQELFDKHYYEKLNKYSTQSREEQENQTPFDDDYKNTSSLKYHLEKRGII
jgi:outer membrane receptor for ferric coprogen and ferric-rhodotorulic acid